MRVNRGVRNRGFKYVDRVLFLNVVSGSIDVFSTF